MDLLKIKIDKITLLNKQEKMYDLLSLTKFKRSLFSFSFIFIGLFYSYIFFSTSSSLMALSYILLSYVSLLVIYVKKDLFLKLNETIGLNVLEYNELINYNIMTGTKKLKPYEYLFYFLSITSCVMLFIYIGETISNIFSQKKLKIDFSKITKEKKLLLNELLDDKETALFVVKNQYNLNVIPRSKNFIVEEINDKYLTEKEKFLINNENGYDLNLNMYFLESKFKEKPKSSSSLEMKHVKIKNE